MGTNNNAGRWRRMRMPFVVAIHGLYASAAAVILPYLDHDARAEIFAADGLSPLERVYSEEFKRATASGEQSRGAHVRALEAVHRRAVRVRQGSAVRLTVARWLSRVGNFVEPS